jgi:hypothetical protein
MDWKNIMTVELNDKYYICVSAQRSLETKLVLRSFTIKEIDVGPVYDVFESDVGDLKCSIGIVEIK